MYDSNGNLTRAGMEKVIASGGSVSYGGRIISSVAGLPAVEDLAKTEGEKSAVATELDRQIAALQARRDAITPKASTPSADESKSAADANDEKPATPAAHASHTRVKTQKAD